MKKQKGKGALPDSVLYFIPLCARSNTARTTYGAGCVCGCAIGVVLAHLVMWSAITTETYTTCTFTKTYGVSGLFLGSHRCVGCVGFALKCRAHVWVLTIILFQNCFARFLCFATRESINVVESFLCNTLHIKT